MNKTVSANISGFVFNIEENAYDQLRQYLKSIRSKFNDEEEREEIMADIEARIAELFQERISLNKEVILETDISDIIEILGQPADFSTEDETISDSTNNYEKQKTGADVNESIRRKLFRDKDDAILGGVCSGLSYYFNVDVFIIRLLFVVLFITAGSGVLLYIILLIILPEAKTTADILQMKGQSVNLESIKSHISNLKASVSDKTKNKLFKQKVTSTVDRGVKVSQTILQVIGKIIGVVFTFGGLFFFSIMVLILFGNFSFLPFLGDSGIDSLPVLIDLLYPEGTNVTFLFIVSAITALVPVILVIAVGVKILFNLRQKLRIFIVSLITIWFVSATIAAVKGVTLGTNFAQGGEAAYRIPLADSTSNMLNLELLEDDRSTTYFANRFM